MSNSDLEIAADLLVAARRSGRRIERLAEGCRPRTDAAGYAVQRRVISRLGAIGGYKIGADSALATPQYAPILASEMYGNGVSLAAADYRSALIEAELAFRLLRDLPPRSTPYDYESLAAATECLPVFEIYSSRYQASEEAATTVPEQLADCLANRGLIYGAPVAIAGLSLSATWTIALNIDGARKRVCDVRHPVGDPLNLLVWLANELASHGSGLRVRDIVTTGAFIFLPIGANVSGEWQGLGSVSANFN